MIYRRGGVLFLFRGRNYNHRTRPRFPLMLWKPVAPVYPKLIQQIPEGLTLQEATEMRRKGRELMPICKLGKLLAYVGIIIILIWFLSRPDNVNFILSWVGSCREEWCVL